MSQAAPASNAPIMITPLLEVGDDLARYWLAQATLRLRRESCWCWYLRTDQTRSTGIPPIMDQAVENLELTRHDAEKRRFFSTDVTANYLSEMIESSQSYDKEKIIPGSWEWLQDNLGLDDAAQFVLALGLAARADSSIGPVISACMNDASRPFPTLALAQRLWDDPKAVIACADPTHVLYRSGLLQLDDVSGNGVIWQRPLDMHSFIASSLLNPLSSLPNVLTALDDKTNIENDAVRDYLPILKSRQLTTMQVVPMICQSDSDFISWAMSLSKKLDRRAIQLIDGMSLTPSSMSAIATLAWMRGIDIVLPLDWDGDKNTPASEQWITAVQSIPARWYVPTTDVSQLKCYPLFSRLPAFNVPLLSFEARRTRLKKALGKRAAGLKKSVDECARRFRFQDKTLDRIEQTIKNLNGTISGGKLISLCRTEATTRLGDLAQSVEPRFDIKELVLPPGGSRQFEEVVTAMNSLTEVHYQWGTSQVWNESGLTVMFYGPPGTGKTMAAEALARTLDLPMYRIDLSQVVNKYIGETEKNLKKIFDAAELSDCILFFDEADALFGKRTEVKDAHDRFANIEISYLLERMERFKGLAILATNRKKDMDEAFLRRLRYVVNFPLPESAEREKIWRQVFPKQVNISELNIPYLANQFSLSGGHIRSIAFNACLQSTEVEKINNAKYVGSVNMNTVLIAVKRELDKLERSASAELFGEYAMTIRELNDV